MSEPLLIIGAGIAGLTSALALAHFGQPSEVYEKAASLDEVGAGIQLSPNAMNILAALGLSEALMAQGVAPSHIAIGDGRNGNRLATVPLGETARARYDAPYIVIHRADLQNVLVAACEANPHITIKLGETVEPKDQEGLTLAADGVHSAWRAMVRNPSHMRFTGYVAWRTVIPVDAPDPSPHTQVWMGPNAHVVDYPIRRGEARNLVAIAKASDPRPIRADVQGLLEKTLTDWHAPLRARLTQIEDWTPWPLFGVEADSAWVTESIALVGDAAHAMLPFAAQGGAMAIEDAWVLAQMITSSSQADQALARYEMARKTRVTRVWKEAKRNGEIYHLTGPMAFARNAVLKARSGDALLARYDWLYGWRPSQT